MSYSAEIRFSFLSRSVTDVEVIRTLLRNGWVAGNGNRLGMIGVSWMGGEGRDLQNESYPANALSVALERLEQFQSSGVAFFFDLSWIEDATPICLRHDPSDYRLCIQLPSLRHPMLAAPSFSDHSWYVQRLMQPLQQLEMQIDMMEWVEYPSL